MTLIRKVKAAERPRPSGRAHCSHGGCEIGHSQAVTGLAAQQSPSDILNGQ